jgi:hypothetical protein
MALNAKPPYATPFSTSAGFIWTGESVSNSIAGGFAKVRLPSNCSPCPDSKVVVAASLETKKPELVLFTTASKSIKQTTQIVFPPLFKPRRLGGKLNDIPIGDVVQTSPSIAQSLGKWAFLISRHYLGPVRIESRDHVPNDAVRISYCGRQLFSLDKDDRIWLQPWATRYTRMREKIALRLAKCTHVIGEAMIGAPVIPLRATEGLAGDDGHLVVRADATVIDFLGVSPGGHVVVSWADRSVTARILPQTDVTRAWMEEQLAEKSGRQIRSSICDITSRTVSPPHIRVWVSASVRFALGAPPDTVIRLRRSIRHFAFKAAASVAIPLTALIVAMAAVPQLWLVWVISFFVVILFSILTQRLSTRPDGR